MNETAVHRRLSPQAGREITGSLGHALAQGPGVVELPAGTFRCEALSVPCGVTLSGTGAGTVLQPVDSRRPVLEQRGAGDWCIRNLTLNGGGEARCGLRIEDCWRYTVADVAVSGFADGGVHIARTRLSREAAAYCDGGLLERLRCCDNALGVLFDERAEYVSLVNSQLYRNQVACLIHAGNVRIAHCNIGCNRDGVVVQDKENGSHGVIAHCLINHNERDALRCHGVRNGMLIAGCCIYGGRVVVEDAVGVALSGSQLDCSLIFRGGGGNRLSDNFIIEGSGEHALGRETLVIGNTTPRGAWRHNRGPAPMKDARDGG